MNEYVRREVERNEDRDPCQYSDIRMGRLTKKDEKQSRWHVQVTLFKL